MELVSLLKEETWDSMLDLQLHRMLFLSEIAERGLPDTEQMLATCLCTFYNQAR